MRAEILKFIVLKGEWKQPSINTELLDLHSNYESSKNTLTNIGGQFQQLYYVVSQILDIYGDDLSELYKRRQLNPADDLSKKALNARELMVEQFFLPFLIYYLRD
jgi:hypothetical protein